MEELILIPVSDLKQLLRETIRLELNNHPRFAEPTEILDTQGVASLLKVSMGFIVSLRKKGLPFYVLGNGTGAIRYNRGEVLAYMSQLKK